MPTFLFQKFGKNGKQFQHDMKIIKRPNTPFIFFKTNNIRLGTTAKFLFEERQEDGALRRKRSISTVYRLIASHVHPQLEFVHKCRRLLFYGIEFCLDTAGILPEILSQTNKIH